MIAIPSKSVFHWIALPAFLKDHFSLDHSWDECVKKTGLKLLAFDELNKSTIADIVVNYSPEAVKPETLGAKNKFLGGEQYFISNIKKRGKNVEKKMPTKGHL